MASDRDFAAKCDCSIRESLLALVSGKSGRCRERLFIVVFGSTRFGQRGKREPHFADESRWFEEHLGSAPELLEGSRKKTNPKPGFPRQTNGRTARLPPFEMEKLARHPRRQGDTTFRLRQGPVLCGVGGELMNQESDGQCVLRWKKHVRSLNGNARRHVGTELGFGDIMDECALRVGFLYQTVGRAQSLQA